MRVGVASHRNVETLTARHGGAYIATMAHRNTVRWVVAAIVALGIATIVVANSHDPDQQQAKRETADREWQAAKAVSVLPSGTEDAWIAYVDRKIAAAITRKGNAIHVVGLMGFFPHTLIVWRVPSSRLVTRGS